MKKFRRADHLGLTAVLADRLLPILVGAMSFLAALAIAGTIAAAAFSAHWQSDTGTSLTIQVPDPANPAATGKATRLAAILALLQASPAVASPHNLSDAELNNLLRPWLGADVAQLALPVPAVITASLTGTQPLDQLQATLAQAAPGTLVETGSRWAARVAALTASLQASAATILVIVAFVAAAVVSIATRAGLAQRRDAIEIIHGLGALDGDIAERFAARATSLAAIGAACGAVLALPVLFWLAGLAAPFSGFTPHSLLPALPATLWASLPALPVFAAAIGWSTAQFTVRSWLRSLA
jgi:cell division transport system permease protein